MVDIGVDSHKRSHTAVAVDATRREARREDGAATSAGHLELLRWADRFPDRHCGARGLPPSEPAAVLRPRCSPARRSSRVPPKLMAGARRSAREPGKSRSRSTPSRWRVPPCASRSCPRRALDGIERELRLLVDHREDLVAERTRTQNRLRWHLHELEPGFEPPARALDRPVSSTPSPERDVADGDGTVARIALELVARIRELTRSIDALEREISRLVGPLAP